MNELTKKPLSDLITINEQYARSTRIDQDDIAASGFIYSSSIDIFLNTLAKHQSNSQQSAFTWTGPYGSGKSTLALSLTSILKGSAANRAAAAQNYTPQTAQNIWAAFPPGENGWDIISLVGRRTSLEKLLVEELKLDENDNAFADSSQKSILSALKNRIHCKPSDGGLVLFVDEMGKLLEAAADGDGDVYFYQLIAELASRSNGRFIIIGILHQTFQEYAATASKKIRDEWGKVHGRFVDISFNLTNSEQLELISNAITSEVTPSIAIELADQAYQLLEKSKRAPTSAMLNQMANCWPLNPICALALGPISRRSYGQNQRSIFSFLTSGEPLGLRDFVNRTLSGSESIYSIANLWDYLELNWGSAISVSGDSHHFANVRDALSRLETMEEARPEHQLILKAISIFELTEQLTGLPATHEALQIALNVSSHKVTRDTNFLLRNSLLIFKKYKKTFALFEGSDFDIEAELAESLKTSSIISTANVMQPFLPSEIVAKRHYFETGTLRWAKLCISSLDEADSLVETFKPNASSFGLLVIVDTNDEAKFEVLVNRFGEKHHPHVIFGRTSIGAELNEHLSEYLALERISQNSNALLKDKVARRETRDRLEASKGIIENLVSSITSQTVWAFNENEHAVLSQLASALADRVFPLTPVLKNELVNRSKPSGSASAALKQLNYALLKNAANENLGFEKYPAERGIYESLIKRNGLHLKSGDDLKILSPSKLQNDSDQSGLKPLWINTKEYLEQNKHRKVTLDEIHKQVWASPPFGIKAGLFSLLDVLFYLTEKDKIAFYREEIFISKIGEIDIDFIHKTPALIELRWLDMDANTKTFLSKLSELTSEISGNKTVSIEPLEVARDLVALYDEVEPWATRTSRISENAKKVRTLFKKASDPAQFTLGDLPNLNGHTDISDNESVERLIHKIKDGLIELRCVYRVTISRFRDLILNELGVSVVSENNIYELKKRAGLIKGMSGNHNMETFILHASQLTTGLEAFERLGWGILNKPNRNWIDADIDRLFVEATKLAREFNCLETMTSIKGKTQSKYAFSLLSHNRTNNTGAKSESFELSEQELSDAQELVSTLKTVKNQSNKKPTKRELLAAMVLLTDERNVQ